MPSKIPAILDALAARLATVPGIAAVYRVLEGAPLPDEDAADLPAIYFRLISDAFESAQQAKARIAVQVAVELFFVPGAAIPMDAQAAEWVWKIRHALAQGENHSLAELLRADPAPGIAFSGASYHYPQQLGETASVRQPLALRCVENY